jgi:hypothetical protein
VAFVGYRDHCDGPQRLAVLRLTTDLSAFDKIICEQKPTGGGDGPEDIHGEESRMNIPAQLMSFLQGL